MIPTPPRLRGRTLAAIDAAILWRIGLVRPSPSRGTAPPPAEPTAFWAESRAATPVPLEVRRRGTSENGVRVLDLSGDSGGPGGHPGSRRFAGRARIRSSAFEAPLVLLLHGYAAPLPTYEDWHAWRLLRRGAHAARIDLPFHLSRRVPGQRSGDGFFSTDLDHDRVVFRQAVEDAASVVAWARREVTSRVAVLGFSLGGLVACLLAAVVPLDAVVAVTPPCDLADTMLERCPGRIRRQLGLVGGSGGPWGADAAAARGVLDSALAPVTPRLLHPVTDPARTTVVCAEYDGIVGAGPVRQLAAAWGAELLEYRQGHISVMSARGISRRLHDRLLRTTPVTAPAAAV